MDSLTDTQKKRFVTKVKKGKGKDPCWVWVGAKLTTGYGVFSIEGKSVMVHRLATGGKLSPNNHVYHTCGNKACVNPDHLRVGDNPLSAVPTSEFFKAARKVVSTRKKAN